MISDVHLWRPRNTPAWYTRDDSPCYWEKWSYTVTDGSWEAPPGDGVVNLAELLAIPDPNHPTIQGVERPELNTEKQI